MQFVPCLINLPVFHHGTGRTAVPLVKTISRLPSLLSLIKAPDRISMSKDVKKNCHCLSSLSFPFSFHSSAKTIFKNVFA